MKYVGAIVGGLLMLLGLAWIGQGINLLPGSMMSGHPVYAVLGLVVVVLGGALIYFTSGSVQTRQG